MRASDLSCYIETAKPIRRVSWPLSVCAGSSMAEPSSSSFTTVSISSSAGGGTFTVSVPFRRETSTLPPFRSDADLMVAGTSGSSTVSPVQRRTWRYLLSQNL